MSDYTLNRRGRDPADVAPPPMEYVTREFEGYPLRMARRPGGEACIFAEDSLRGIGSDMRVGMRSLHDSLTFEDVVNVDGIPRRVRLLTRRDFLFICLKNRSPRLDEYRRKVVDILETLEETGSFSYPGASPASDLPASASSDPIIAMRLKQMEFERELAEVRSTARSALAVRGEVADLREQVGRGPTHWTVAAWFAQHGYRITVDAAKEEGKRLRRICQQMGFVIPDEKVSNGSDFPSRRWPIEAINVWWPECKQRKGLA